MINGFRIGQQTPRLFDETLQRVENAKKKIQLSYNDNAARRIVLFLILQSRVWYFASFSWVSVILLSDHWDFVRRKAKHSIFY